MKAHDYLCNLLETLGYKNNQAGCCNGSTIRWLEAVLNQEENIFDRRMDDIIDNFDTLPRSIKRTKAKKGQKLVASDEQILDIWAFLESIELYQNIGNRHRDLGNLPLANVPMIEFEESHAFYGGSETTRKRGGLKQLDSNLILFSKTELTEFLKQLGQILENLDTNEPVGLHLGNTMHVTGLTYSKGQGWRFMNIDTYPTVQFTLEQTDTLVDEIFSGLHHTIDTDLILEYGLITSAEHPKQDELISQLVSLKTKYSLNKIHLDRYAKEHLAHYFSRYNYVDALKTLANWGYDLNQSWLERDNLTPLHVAVVHGCTESVTALVEARVDIDVKARDESTPIELALFHGHDKIVKNLAQDGASVDQKTNNGVTFIHKAGALNNPSMLNTLVDLGLDIHAKTGDLWGVAHFAAVSGSVKLIKTLASYGVDFNAMSSLNLTPLHLAAIQGHIETFNALIFYGADINKLGEINIKELANIIAENGHTSILSELIKQGVSPHQVSEQGETLAFKAVFSGAADFIIYLMQLGVDFSIPCMISVNDLTEMKGAKSQYVEYFIEQHRKHHPSQSLIPVTPDDLSFLLDKNHLARLLKQSNQVQALYQPINALLQLHDNSSVTHLAEVMKEALAEYLNVIFSQYAIYQEDLDLATETFLLALEYVCQKMPLQGQTQLVTLSNQFKLFSIEVPKIVILEKSEDHYSLNESFDNEDVCDLELTTMNSLSEPGQTEEKITREPDLSCVKEPQNGEEIFTGQNAPQSAESTSQSIAVETKAAVNTLRNTTATYLHTLKSIKKKDDLINEKIGVVEELNMILSGKNPDDMRGELSLFMKKQSNLETLSHRRYSVKGFDHAGKVFLKTLLLCLPLIIDIATLGTVKWFSQTHKSLTERAQDSLFKVKGVQVIDEVSKYITPTPNKK